MLWAIVPGGAAANLLLLADQRQSYPFSVIDCRSQGGYLLCLVAAELGLVLDRDYTSEGSQQIRNRVAVISKGFLPTTRDGRSSEEKEKREMKKDLPSFVFHLAGAISGLQ